MKNVTLAIDEKLLEQARELAERRGTTLNALVRTLLAHELRSTDRVELARQGMRELMQRSTLEFAPGTNVKELSRRYDADELHGHQHPDLGSGKKAAE